MKNAQQALRALAQRRWRMAIALSVVMVAIYFGFILLIAFDKAAMSALIMPGLSVGIVLGALVILLTWVTTLFYVWWANRYVDGEITRLNAEPAP